MEKYRQRIKKRLWIFRILLLVFIAFIFWNHYQMKFHGDSGTYTDGFLLGFLCGATIGINLLSCVMVLKYEKALRNDTLLKKMYIAETDERRKLIQEKSGGYVILICAVILIAAAVATGYIVSFEVFVTLYACAVFLLLTKAILKLYYNHKY